MEIGGWRVENYVRQTRNGEQETKERRKVQLDGEQMNVWTNDYLRAQGVEELNDSKGRGHRETMSSPNIYPK